MNRDGAVAACAAQSGAVLEYPFGPDTAVFKVKGKMFAIVGLAERPARISLKCDPDLSDDLRARYVAVTPGYHLNKRHWNTIVLDGSVPAAELDGLIRHSHDLVAR